MAAYNDDNWVQTLKSLGLAAKEYAAAKLLLVGKDAAYRKVMLGDDNESNRNVILQALGKSSLPMGCMGLLGGKEELCRVPSAARAPCTGLWAALKCCCYPTDPLRSKP